MAYYTYSVKQVLTEYFGADAVSAMRRPCDAYFSPEDKEHLIPLSWQYADRQVLRLFLEHRFLVDTIIEDDCIAYLYQQGDQPSVLLMFMLYEDKAPFSIAADYAHEMIRKWEADGYNTKIVSQSVCVEHRGNRRDFRLSCHVAPGLGTYIYRLIENFGRPILIFDSHDCWPVYEEKLVHVSKTRDLREYECLFEPRVSITTGDRKNKKTIASGIKAIRGFLRKNAPVRTCLVAFENTEIYERCLLAGDKKLSIGIDARNLISEVNVSQWEGSREIACDIQGESGRLAAQLPSLLSVRPLDVVQMHGYAIQMTYSDGSVRNYYLKTFDTPQIPDRISVDRHVFDERVLHSVAIKGNGVRFCNGYKVRAHHLFYRSYRQVQATVTGPKSCPVGSSILTSRYLLPLKEFKDHFMVKHYWSHYGECFGPADALFDPYGKRITDISFYGPVENWRSESLWRVCVEPTRLYGFLRGDGTWLAPPVYTFAEQAKNGCAKAERNVNGCPKRVLITPEGREIDFDYEINTTFFDEGLFPFNVAVEPIAAPEPEYDLYCELDDMKPGKWGFVDMNGQVVVEPQYTYAVGFWNGGGKRAVVARLVGEKLLWGAIDRSGKEVIPCRYEMVYTRWGDAFAFRREGEKLNGVMDLDGNIIAEPQFDYFEAYDAAHQLLTVGEHEYALGVYSLALQKMIIPMEYDCIDYGEKIINCEIAYTGKERYFDYDGNELDFPTYDRVYEDKGLLRTWKDGKLGLIQMDGTVVIPNILCSGHANDAFSLHQKGYMITGKRKQWGLATVDGTEILPRKYTEIIAYDDFVVASERDDAGWSICDTLYAYDGTPILQGPYRRMTYDRKQRQLTVETPYGMEYFGLHDLTTSIVCR